MRKDIFNKIFLAPILTIVTVLAVFLSPAGAFYERQGDEGSLDLRGVVRIFGTAYANPDNPFFFEESSESGLAGIARLIMEAQSGNGLGIEVNAYQTWIPEGLLGIRSGLGTAPNVERSDALERSLGNDRYAHLVADRLNIRWSKGPLDLTLGRQPVNLATTFYFTPNDFFAPFAAQTFYRVYKPGVDALRAEIGLGGLSQLSLISVLGYSRDPNSDTGWSDDPLGDRTSYIGRISTVFHDFEWALLGGQLQDRDVAGGSIQGELFRWLGVRAEGHLAFPEDPREDSYWELSAGLEHRWENSLNVRLEHFYHGLGAGSVSDYLRIPSVAIGDSLYLGRHYTALGVGYEFTPLLNAEILVIVNMEDDSSLWSFNAVYSLSNEAELSLDLGAPWGKKPFGADVRSEFGLYPYSINLEIRYFF